MKLSPEPAAPDHVGREGLDCAHHLPNFVCTPHLAEGTRQAAEKAAAIAAEELKLYLAGKPLRYPATG